MPKFEIANILTAPKPERPVRLALVEKYNLVHVAIVDRDGKAVDHILRFNEDGTISRTNNCASAYGFKLEEVGSPYHAPTRRTGIAIKD